MLNKRVGFVIASFIIVGLLPGSAHAAGRVNLSPATINLTEGQSQVVTITLDEPIIAPSSPYVEIDLSTAYPDRVQLSTNTITIPGSEWVQPHTFTITAVDDAIVNGDITNVVTVGPVVSNSEFYSNYVPSLTANISDNDVAPPVTVLPKVGEQQSYLLAVLISSLVLTFQLIRTLRSAKHED